MPLHSSIHPGLTPIETEHPHRDRLRVQPFRAGNVSPFARPRNVRQDLDLSAPGSAGPAADSPAAKDIRREPQGGWSFQTVRPRLSSEPLIATDSALSREQDRCPCPAP